MKVVAHTALLHAVMVWSSSPFVERLMESDSNKNLTESTKGIPPSFSSASILAKERG